MQGYTSGDTGDNPNYSPHVERPINCTTLVVARYRLCDDRPHGTSVDGTVDTVEISLICPCYPCPCNVGDRDNKPLRPTNTLKGGLEPDYRQWSGKCNTIIGRAESLNAGRKA